MARINRVLMVGTGTPSFGSTAYPGSFHRAEGRRRGSREGYDGAVLALLLWVPVAAAGPFVLEIGPPVDVDLPGRHARPFVDATGAWRLAFGRSGSFHAVPLDVETLRVDLEAQQTLVPLGIGIDHGFVSCPDGGWLHVASSHGAHLDDGATATLLDADLRILAQRALLRDSPHLATNDMALVCGAGLRGAAFAERGVEGGDEVTGDWFFALDDAFFDGGAAIPVDVSPSTRVTGNSMRWLEDDRQLHIFGMERDIGLRVAIFDENLALRSLEDRPAPPAPRVGWWASGIAPVGGGALLVHMAADPVVPWNLDTGDVALVVLGPDLTVLEQHALTALPPPNGAMRPGIAVDGDTVVVSFDVGGAIQLQRLRIDRAAFLALDAEAGGGGAG